MLVRTVLESAMRLSSLSWATAGSSRVRHIATSSNFFMSVTFLGADVFKSQSGADDLSRWDLVCAGRELARELYRGSYQIDSKMGNHLLRIEGVSLGTVLLGARKIRTFRGIHPDLF